MTWHVIHTKPKQEKRALENLQKQDFECFLPTCSIEKIRRGRITVSLEPLFPRYLFINLKQGTNWAPIRS
ncbi:MAG TPA: transcription/translation regulatory transformer protein RfaH, partial [Methylococcaceae bacterium]|nr:transcription/translation regulatory transformer protein RfaH [Methylococcaceae bacterium]